MSLCNLKAKLNVNTNRWAMEVFDAALDGFLGKDNNAKEWNNNEWPNVKLPSRVAIILDEATDITLVKGLIESVRVLMSKKSYLAREKVVLVLVGTGLDSIRYENRVGTNPALSRLVQMEGPNLEALKDSKLIHPVAFSAMTQGTFANILRTNTRMLFRSVLPILLDPKNFVDGEFNKNVLEQRLEDRLVEIGSVRSIMDHGARFFVRHNSIGSLDAVTRNSLLVDAFLYHMIVALEKRLEQVENETVKSILEKELSETKDLRSKAQMESNLSSSTSETIFTIGLAVQSGVTSPALKYLACFGLSCELRPGFGSEFEELTALHFMRRKQIEGYAVRRLTLHHAWPPKANKENITVDDMTELKDKLKKQAPIDCRGKYCLIFSQGTPTAQGGNVMALTVEGDKGELVTIQCKHYAKESGDISSWWSTLGIDCTSGEKANFEPDTGKAGYSYAGLEHFRVLLRTKVVPDVKIGERILAVSFRAPPKAPFAVPRSDDDNSATVWFREMLEPSISTFRLRSTLKQNE